MPDALDNAVTTTSRRLRSRQLVRVTSIGAAVGLTVGVVAALLLGSPAATLLPIASALFGALLGGVHASRRLCSPPAAVIWLDRQLALQDLLPAAWHAEGMAGTYLRAQANQKLATLSRLPTPPWPTRSLGGALVTGMLVAVVALVRTPASSAVELADGRAEPSTSWVPDTTDTPMPETVRDVAPVSDTSSETAVPSNGDAANAGNAPAVGDHAAATDTLSVTTPRRGSTSDAGDGPPGSGGNAAEPGTEVSNANAGNDSLIFDATSAANADANADAPTVPAHLRDLVDAYFR